ncbi:hypothetical protein Hokovirus_1_134 [Hokovirus HKV1]|uniref:Uncharacterized protein n=1 Tax=Hokovirus HKV1 TaxID=1977638 RepID=A0A1V0SEV5_9VIRU|nr:hypothetical protein Hokovirus_1_134 [Hokovirus HKV1]
MFNVYFSNVITGYNDLTYPYCFDPECLKEENKQNQANKEQYYKKISNYRHLTLLLMGIICIIISFFIPHSTIKLALLLSGIFTLLYSIGSNWQNYNDVNKMFITGFGVFAIIGLILYYGDVYKIK